MTKRPWLLLTVLTAASLARAEPVLHERVPRAASEEGELLVAGQQDEGGEPSALVYHGEVIPPPADTKPTAGEPALSATSQPGFAPSFRPDRLTELESMLSYQAVFAPSITPFKRITALDVIRLDADGKTPVLTLGSAETHALRVEGADVPPPDARPRDPFWGRVVLDFRQGRRVPLPSVSPESRILTARTDPHVELRFEKNGADDYFAVAVGDVPQEPVRLVFLMDAPRTYFGTAIPNVAADTLQNEVPPLPRSVKSRGLEFARELGVGPDDPLPVVLRTLAGYFRSFQESAVPPANHGDVYLDLARSKKGVCRHRAYAFVVTAQALGIPARFVYNEAHSFAEVRMPGVGWMRVDLGGAARGLVAHGAEDVPQYSPPQPDPLPRPESYVQSYSQLGGNVSGVRISTPSHATSEVSWEDGGEPNDEPSDGQGEGAQRQAPSVRPAARVGSGDRSEDEQSSLMPLQIELEHRRYEAYRGRMLEVAGRVISADGKGVAGLRIEVRLARQGEERLLGVTVSGDQGWFHASFGVPPRMPVGDYRLVVRTPGDATHAAAVAD